MEEGSDHDIFVCEKCPETFKRVENLASHTVRLNYNALLYIYELKISNFENEFTVTTCSCFFSIYSMQYFIQLLS